ncbi:SEED MATURATION PROTEIN 1 [Andrographis paniculata]|uniref:SEED MATURATION PROTEIN 1 n=1 Tax=Andrographis paniculata TaxID=175694 RepID=UPI0021E6FFBE|nr:SEED MATURATION PROTEIN 1 [Andrographis paniculata]
MAARGKDDIKHATAQAKLSEDEALRVGYCNGTPLESGKIADSQPVDLFSGARNIAEQEEPPPTNQQSRPPGAGDEGKQNQGSR